MKRAAIGIRAHSGWGALVVVTGSPAKVEVIDRRRIVIADPAREGAKQPYHFAQGQSLQEAERHIAECAAVSERLAFESLAAIVGELKRYKYVAAGCAILLASGRSLPSLPQILASHSLIHTAEGEFFRRAFWKAGERLRIEVTGMRERDLDESGAAVFGSRAREVRQEIASLGATVGPPWTADQKCATFAALLILAGGKSCLA